VNSSTTIVRPKSSTVVLPCWYVWKWDTLIDEICCHSLTDSFVHVLLGCCWMAHFRITPTPLGQHLWTPACCRCQW
jgi:hypothetical protein